MGLAVGERERELERLALIQPMGQLVVPGLPWHPPRTLVKFLGHEVEFCVHCKPATVARCTTRGRLLGQDAVPAGARQPEELRRHLLGHVTPVKIERGEQVTLLVASVPGLIAVTNHPEGQVVTPALLWQRLPVVRTKLGGQLGRGTEHMTPTGAAARVTR